MKFLSLSPVAQALVALVVTSVAHPQMQLKTRLDGDLLPIVEISRDYYTVLHNGKKRQTRDLDYKVLPSSTFAAGFVEIRDVEADLDPLREAPIKEKTKPSAIRFKYRAQLTSDSDMPDTYAVLTFTAQGSIGTHVEAIGRLSRGRTKSIEIELRSQVDAVGTLHVFSGGDEVRTTHHDKPYDVREHYAALARNAPGLSAAELLKFEEVYPHELSRSGERLATIREREAKKVLIAYDLNSMKLLCELPVTESDDVVRDLRWISEEQLVYIAEEDYRDQRSRMKLFLLDVRTGKATELLEDVRHIVQQLVDRPEVLVLYRFRWGHGAWTVKYNVTTREISDVGELDSGYSLFDRQGNARVRYKYEGDRRIYYFRPTPEARWQELDNGVKQSGLRFTLKGSELLDRVVDVHSIGPDGDTLYVSTRLNSDRFELAAFSMSQGVIRQVIAKHPKYDLTTSDGGLSRLLFAKQSPQLLGMVFEAQKPQVAWLNSTHAAVQKDMDASFPNHVNLPIDWSEDAKTFIYYSYSDQDPGTYYVYQPAQSRLIPLLVLGERLAGRTLAKTTPWEFPARDGVKIPAYVTRPTDQATARRPLIVNIHGGPMARDSFGFTPLNQFLASRGYIVLEVNYRGSSGYGAAFQNAGLRARLDTVVLDDIADGVRALVEAGEVDPARIGVMGASFGGWATYMSLIKYPDLYRAGIAIAAISNWRKSLRDDRWQFANKIAYTYWKSLLERANFAEVEPFIDPYLRASELKQPIYIMHGEYDDIVSPTEAKLMLEALRKHNPNVEARSFVRAGHSYWPYEDRVIEFNEVARFFSRHLAPATEPVAIAAAP